MHTKKLSSKKRKHTLKHTSTPNHLEKQLLIYPTKPTSQHHLALHHNDYNHLASTLGGVFPSTCEKNKSKEHK